MKDKERIATLLSFVHQLPSRHSSDDYQNILWHYHNVPTTYDIFQAKERETILNKYNEMQLSPDVASLTEYYEALIVLAIVKTLN